MVASSFTSKRRRGALLGNQNARKHSLFASPKPHLADSKARPLDLDFQAKIDFIRQSMLLVQDLGEPHTYHDAVDYLRALTLTCLARTQHHLHLGLDPHDELVREIRQALQEVNAQLESGGSSPT
jgi:hypothetical protein